MTSLRSDAALRRQQILDAADAVFAEHGIGAPLDLVVTRAAVGRATLYRNFPDRAALVEALFERALAGLEMQARAAGADLFALLELAALRLVDSPALADYWRAVEPGHPGAKLARDRLARCFRAPLAIALKAGTCRPDLRTSDLVLVCGMLGAALRGANPANRRSMVRRALALLRGGLSGG